MKRRRSKADYIRREERKAIVRLVLKIGILFAALLLISALKK